MSRPVRAFAHVLSPVIGLLLLSACGSGSDSVNVKDESLEDVAKKVAESDIGPRPGKWETKITVQNLEIEDMPPEMKEAMKTQMAKAQTSATCLTKEQAKRPNAEFFRPGQASGCKYKHFTMAEGKVDGEMTCDSQGAIQNMKMQGTYGPEIYTMKVDADSTIAGKAMKMTTTVESKRIGECDG